LNRVFDDCIWYRVGALVWGQGGNTNIHRMLKSSETREREDKKVEEMLTKAKKGCPKITRFNFGSALRFCTIYAESCLSKECVKNAEKRVHETEAELAKTKAMVAKAKAEYVAACAEEIKAKAEVDKYEADVAKLRSLFDFE